MKAFSDKAKYEAEYKDKAEIGDFRGEVNALVVVGDYKF